MRKTIDARGLSCPQPVVLTIHALEEADEVTTIVDSEVARNNIFQLGTSKGYAVSVEPKNDGTYLTLRKAKSVPEEREPVPATGTVLFIASDILGKGDNRQLGSLLMQSFLHTISSLKERPETIIFINDGVKLVIIDSPVIGELRQLESQGIEIIACGTCLSRFQLTDKVAVGQVSNMYTIADTLLHAGKVVSL